LEFPPHFHFRFLILIIVLLHLVIEQGSSTSQKVTTTSTPPTHSSTTAQLVAAVFAKPLPKAAKTKAQALVEGLRSQRRSPPPTSFSTSMSQPRPSQNDQLLLEVVDLEAKVDAHLPPRPPPSPDVISSPSSPSSPSTPPPRLSSKSSTNKSSAKTAATTTTTITTTNNNTNTTTPPPSPIPKVRPPLNDPSLPAHGFDLRQMPCLLPFKDSEKTIIWQCQTHRIRNSQKVSDGDDHFQLELLQVTPPPPFFATETTTSWKRKPLVEYLLVDFVLEINRLKQHFGSALGGSYYHRTFIPHRRVLENDLIASDQKWLDEFGPCVINCGVVRRIPAPSWSSSSSSSSSSTFSSSSSPHLLPSSNTTLTLREFPRSLNGFYHALHWGKAMAYFYTISSDDLLRMARQLAVPAFREYLNQAKLQWHALKDEASILNFYTRYFQQHPYQGPTALEE
jgi:hypothetical protein